MIENPNDFHDVADEKWVNCYRDLSLLV